MALSLAPGWPRGAVGRRGGDQLLEVGGGGDLDPGRVGVDLDRDAAVLVGAVLVDPPGVLGLPHLLGQDALPLGQLKVDEDIGVGEVVARLEVPPSEEAGGQNFPGTARLPVRDTENEAGVGPLLLEDVAGGDVADEELDTCLLLDQSNDHLRVVFHPGDIAEHPLLLVQDAGLLVSVGRGDDQVAFHASLLDFIRVIFSLVEQILQLQALSLQLHDVLRLQLLLLLQSTDFLTYIFQDISVELDRLGMISYLLDHLGEELDELVDHLGDSHIGSVVSFFLLNLILKVQLDVGQTFGFGFLKELTCSSDKGRHFGALLDALIQLGDSLDWQLGSHDY